MQLKRLLLGVICAVSCVSAFAGTTTVKEKIKLHDMDCSTFIALGPEHHTKVVYWSVAHHNRNTDTKDVYIDIKGLDATSSEIVQHCKSAPGTNFYEVVKIKTKN